MKMSAFALGLLLLLSCSKDGEVQPGEVNYQQGYASGVAKDASGKPLKGVKIIVDHTIFYNSNISTFTSEKGTYKVKVPTGSWFAFAQHTVNYNGKSYSFYLHPDNPAGFGGEGAVRNFEWKLTGKRPEPLSGEYGGLVTFDSYPGVYIDDKQIEFTFTPLTPLIDGSTGTTLQLKSPDGYHLKDIPMGRYEVTARYQGKSVKLRKWNTDDTFQEKFILDFEPEIYAQCDNCAMLEYNYEN